MENKQISDDLEIKKAPEKLTEQDLENVTGGMCGRGSCPYHNFCAKKCKSK